MAAIVLSSAPALVAALAGSAGLGLAVLAVTSTLSVLTWKTLIAPYLEAAKGHATDAGYRLADAQQRIAVAERDLEETRLREVGASRLALVAQRTSSAVLLTDDRGRIEWVNDGFEKLTGYGFAESVGRSPGTLLRSAKTDAIETDRMRQAVQDGRAYAGEIWNRRKDGTDYLVALEIEPLLTAEGQLTGFMGLEVNVTEQRLLEQDLAELSAHARVEAERLEIALSSGNIGLWDWKPQTGELVVNEHWAHMTGRETTDLARNTNDWKEILHPEDSKAMTGALEAHMANETEFFESTFRIRHIDGSWVWVFSRGKVVERSEDGAPERLVGIQIDRTQDIEHQFELEHLREKAEMASRSKSEFLANVSHEIRTPLTAIIGYADLLREDGDMERAPKRRIEMLDTIQSAGRHLLTLINDILDLSKIEADKMTVEEIDFSLPNLLHEVLELVRPRTESKGLTLDVEIATPIPVHIESDPTRLRQILFNILGNAAKFTETGRVVLRVSATGDGTLLLEVEDTGEGLTSDQLEQLFRPFAQADGTVTRRFGGTGLGLTISRRLARLMGGEVRLVRSEPGTGTVFAIEIPLRTPDGVVYVESLQPPATSTATVGDQPLRLTGRVLLVEDGPVNQRIFATMLERAGAKVDVAGHGEEGLARIAEAATKNWTYDLIITDMQMPVMDGYTLARTLRNRGDETPIIALTAHAMAEDRDRCISAGCDDFLVKPVTRRSLVSACSYWLRDPSSSEAA